MFDIILTIICILAVCLIWVMIYDTNRFVVSKYVFSDSRIKKNCRAVVIADLHNKQYGKGNEKLVEAIRNIKPDFILVAGDIPVATPDKPLDIAVDFIKKISEMCPIYYGNGNHEHRMKLYPQIYGDMSERYTKELERTGVKILVNENITLQDFGIKIYGSEIEKKYYKRMQMTVMEEDYMSKILGTPSADMYNILIAHNPQYFDNYAAWGADLVLSGHIHGGIARIPIINKGIFSPAIQFFPKYDSGRYEIGKSTMLLSRGLGMHTIPIRLFNPGEIIQIDFKSKNE